MKAILLAAGQGTRLRPHTDDRPKCLVPLAGRPLLAWQLEVLHAAGVDDIVVVTGYRAEALAAYGTRRVHNPEYATTNMVHSLFCAAHEFTEPTLVAYTDIVYSGQVVRRVLAAEAACAVAVDRAWETLWRFRHDDPLEDAESLRVDADGHLTEIGQRPGSLAEIQGQYIGLMRFTTDGLASLRRVYDEAAQREAAGAEAFAGVPSLRAAYMTDLLQGMIAAGVAPSAVPISGDWCEVDTVQDLERYEAALAGEAPPGHLRFLRTLGTPPTAR